MLHPTAFNTSEICHSYGVRHVVFSPGSRNAPLTISFARNEKIEKWIIPDERSAGFIGLGIAQKTRQPVVLCCTSGTALLNYGPAIAEAFYRELPLIVLSADRPPDLIDQRDGQTIRQFEALRNHVKKSFQLPLLLDEKQGNEYVTNLASALHLSQDLPPGPVHINIPFKEPFYPIENQQLIFEKHHAPPDQPIERILNGVNLPQDKLYNNQKILILVGQQDYDPALSTELRKLEAKVPIIGSPLSNLKVDGVKHSDLFLNNQSQLQPDILITSGLSVLSKKLKNFLRNNKPKKHVHFDPSGVPVDTYNTNPEILRLPLAAFLKVQSFEGLDVTYLKEWSDLSAITHKGINGFMNNAAFSELSAFDCVLKSLPSGIELHLGNSMPVRFADLLGVDSGIRAWCNRGTSGIDGCVSTALGTSLVSDRLNVLLVGDVSFLYDRNAFFHNYSYPRLRIIVFNNAGGGIFRLIDGPGKLPELEEYFEARHNRTAEYICRENNIAYSEAKDLSGLKASLESFYKDENDTKLLEIFTDPSTNERVFNELKQHIHEQINL